MLKFKEKMSTISIIAIVIATYLLCLTHAFGEGETVQVVQLLPDGSYLGTMNVKDYALDQKLIQTEKFPYATQDSAGTKAGIIVTKDQKWVATGDIGFQFVNGATGGIVVKKFLIWNSGHKVTLSLEKGAKATLRGKLVQAQKAINVILSEKDDSQFKARIKDGSLLILSSKD